MNKPAPASLRRLDRKLGQNALLVLALAGAAPAGAEHRAGPPADRAARLAQSPSAQAHIPVTIAWKMSDRFGPGYDLNRNGRPDLPNSHEYVNPGGYEVGLEALIESSHRSTEGMSCHWTIAGPEGSSELLAAGPKTTTRLPQGNYFVKVAVRLADGRTESAQAIIRVKDILIVALGDSLATGEGNPEVPARWDAVKSSERGSVLRGRIDPSTPAVWADGGPDGHQSRTTPNGARPRPLSRTAVPIARPTPARHSSPCAWKHRIRILRSRSFAWLPPVREPTISSGATAQITTRHWVPGRRFQLSSMSFMRSPVRRTVDILILSIGCNDARGIELVGELMRREIRYVDPLRLLAAYPTRQASSAATRFDFDSLLDPTAASTLKNLSPEARREAIDQDVKLVYSLSQAIESGLASARAQLERVGSAVAGDPILASAQVHLLGLPDLTRESSGASAAAILDDLVPALRVNRRELDLARERLLRPLHQILGDAARAHGWSFTDEVFEAFGPHGYAAEDTWFVRAKESEQIQGPRMTAVGYLRGEIAPGMLHPNERGHQAIADHLLRNHAKPATIQAFSSSLLPGGARWSEIDVIAFPRLSTLRETRR